jgi:hypothetical protein
MKYLVISKPGDSLLKDADVDGLEKAKGMLQKGMDSGVIEGAYAFVGGGTAWIVNTDSHETLARGLRKLGLTGAHQVDVHPILDAIDVLDAYSKHKASK